MSTPSKIEWTDRTWTPVVGCDAVSPACANCYAATMAARLESMGIAKYAGLATRHGAKGKWTGRVNTDSRELLAPLRVRKPQRWFLTSMGDVGHDLVPTEFLGRLFAVMALCPQHTFYVLTKRPDRLRGYLIDGSAPHRIARAAVDLLINQDIPDRILRAAWPVQSIGDDLDWLDDITLHTFPLPNVIIGTTAEDQPRADERRPAMSAIAAAGWRTMVSYEPALGPVDWTGWESLSWLISGGESGPGARASHPDWHRTARDWCAANGVPYLFKQWGEWAPVIDNTHTAMIRSDSGHVFPEPRNPANCDPFWAPIARLGKRAAGRLLDGRTHDADPAQAGGAA